MTNKQRLKHYVKSCGKRTTEYKFPRGTKAYPVTPAQRRRLSKKGNHG